MLFCTDTYMLDNKLAYTFTFLYLVSNLTTHFYANHFVYKIVHNYLYCAFSYILGMNVVGMGLCSFPTDR